MGRRFTGHYMISLAITVSPALIVESTLIQELEQRIDLMGIGGLQGNSQVLSGLNPGQGFTDMLEIF
ncbi:MAG: hypothetical protein ACPLXA_13370 [Moorellaceae bacterium]